jgi:drug/metabolite transporter (DMT)-like permease
MTDAPSARRRATLIGAIAPLLWATLALLTTYARPLPAFELVAMTFALAFLLVLGKWVIGAARGGPSVASRFRLPARAWVTGVSGLFLYHVFYFNALARAPAVEASLICYLWPLLLVLFSAFLPGEKLKPAHILGGLCGLAGAGLLVTKGQGLGFDPAYARGYLAALACAFTWSIYSLLNRRMGAVPSDAVGVYCGMTALLGLACHLIFERWVTPSIGNAAAILLLGIGPVGAAFFVWDYGVKRGDIQALGSLAYASPLISTVLLILAGRAAPSWVLAAGALLIVGGAALAAGGLFARRSR